MNEDFKETREIFSPTVEIGVNELGLTIAGDPKSRLVTFGMGPCTAISGLEHNLGIGFTAHYPAGQNGQDAISTLLYHISRLTKGANALFEVKVEGGLRDKSICQATHEELVTVLAGKVRDDIRFEVTKDTYSSMMRPIGSALGVDVLTRTFIDHHIPEKTIPSISTISMASGILLGLGPTQLKYFPQL